MSTCVTAGARSQLCTLTRLTRDSYNCHAHETDAMENMVHAEAGKESTHLGCGERVDIEFVSSRDSQVGNWCVFPPPSVARLHEKGRPSAPLFLLFGASLGDTAVLGAEETLRAGRNGMHRLSRLGPRRWPSSVGVRHGEGLGCVQPGVLTFSHDVGGNAPFLYTTLKGTRSCMRSSLGTEQSRSKIHPHSASRLRERIGCPP